MISYLHSFCFYQTGQFVCYKSLQSNFKHGNFILFVRRSSKVYLRLTYWWDISIISAWEFLWRLHYLFNTKWFSSTTLQLILINRITARVTRTIDFSIKSISKIKMRLINEYNWNKYTINLKLFIEKF